MSANNFFISKERNNVDHYNYYYFDDVFTEDELTKINNLANSYPKHKGIVVGDDGSNNESNYRKSSVIWIPDELRGLWLYDKISELGNTANTNMWNYEIWGYNDQLQYTIYEGNGGHYDWHADLGPTISNRKLSCVIQLSDPEDYEGGDLQLNNGSGVITIEKKKGRVVFFSSFVLHRVTPVTKGTRISLVSWLSGKNFR
jgi:PKHD-type hydroxylase